MKVQWARRRSRRSTLRRPPDVPGATSGPCDRGTAAGGSIGEDNVPSLEQLEDRLFLRRIEGQLPAGDVLEEAIKEDVARGIPRGVVQEVDEGRAVLQQAISARGRRKRSSPDTARDYLNSSRGSEPSYSDPRTRSESSSAGKEVRDAAGESRHVRIRGRNVRLA